VSHERVIDKKYLPEEVLKVEEKEPVILPAWDPMGAVAKS
jgi:bleomycin hydrolase